MLFYFPIYYNTYSSRIKAYFLVPKFHSFIERNLDGILLAMNARKDNVTYDAIKFDQKKIEADLEKFLQEKLA